LLLGAVAAGIWAAGPVASALATSRYVDDTGTGAAPCTNQNLPCPTIAVALGAATSGDVIHVGGGSYPVNVTLADGISLIKDSFATVPPASTAGAATINTTGNANPAVTVSAGTAARTISGFTLRGGNSVGKSALQVATLTDNVTISGNTFDDASAGVAVQLRISSGSPLVAGNTFVGASDNVTRFAIGYNAGLAGAPEIANNTITNFFEGIQVAGGAPNTVNIHGNTISSIHEAGMAISVGIDVNPGSGSITDNTVSSAPSSTAGIGMLLSTSSSVVPLDVSANQIYGFPEGSEFGSGSVPVTMNNDLYANNDSGLLVFSTGLLTATNLTVSSTGSNSEIYLAGPTVSIALNSSFVGAGGSGVQTNGGTCTSSFSETTHSPVCGMTQVTDPMFTDAPSDDFRPLAASPLIDAGDPAAPSFATDLDGNPRALAILACPARRDVGAYEFATNPLSCNPPPGPPATQPPTTRKKCKKHKKHRSAEIAKKKHCKKRKR
jgi:hypothetical protein